jgi:hypothetical protein
MPRTRSGSKPAPSWTRLPDDELLKKRLCDLDLRIAGTQVARCIRRLHAELERKGLELRPHFWLAEEWFSPDGVPGIAVPFYLSHPRLMRLERRMMREVEGGNANWLMRILRHEAGHAIDSAYRLRRRRRWREVFGPASLRYPDSYRPRPGSRRFVQHLGAWYAQSHPAEDFAETFAVWLTPRASWKHSYEGWPALEKLCYVDELMRELKGVVPPVRSRARVEPARLIRRTLEQHYRARQSRNTSAVSRVADDCIRRIFAPQPATGRRVRAATLIRRLKQPLCRSVAQQLDTSEYLVHQVLRLLIERCEVLELYARDPVRVARPRVERLVRRIARLYLIGSAGRHTL